MDKICEYLDLDGKYVFRGSSPLDLSFVFQIQDSLRNHPELFYEKRVPQKSTQIDSKRSILEQIKEKINYCLIHMRVSSVFRYAF